MKLIFIKVGDEEYALVPSHRCIKNANGIYNIASKQYLDDICRNNIKKYTNKFMQGYYDTFINLVFCICKVVKKSDLSYYTLSSIDSTKSKRLFLTLQIKNDLPIDNLLETGIRFFTQEIVNSQVVKSVNLYRQSFGFHIEDIFLKHFKRQTRLKELNSITTREATHFIKKLTYEFTKSIPFYNTVYTRDDINFARDLILKIKYPTRYHSELYYPFRVICEMNKARYNIVYHSYPYLIESRNLSKLLEETLLDIETGQDLLEIEEEELEELLETEGEELEKLLKTQEEELEELLKTEEEKT
ncbi:hypothetical protein K6025_03415 [Ehrlichia sp. JZT12]